VAVEGQRLAEAMAPPFDDLPRDRLMDQVLAKVPDELIGEVAREAAGHLWLKGDGLPNARSGATPTLAVNEQV
jgi:hypothetical protein